VRLLVSYQIDRNHDESRSACHTSGCGTGPGDLRGEAGEERLTGLDGGGDHSDRNQLPRLSPFAFPTETHLRTTMLIVATLAFCWQIGFATGVIVINLLLDLPEYPTAEAPSIDVLGIYEEGEIFHSAEAFTNAEQRLRRRIATLSNDPAARNELREALERLKSECLSYLTAAGPYFVFPILFIFLVVGTAA